jgi:hypothetical protein
VLAGFEQHSKQTSQLVDQPESQEDNSNTAQLSDLLTGQEAEVKNETGQEADQSASQPAVNPTAEEANKLTSHKAVKPYSQVAVKPTTLDAPKADPVNQPDSQPVDKSTIRKATFQISDAVLQQLDTFHLQLQLELGKANAPYKEVIVEEAIAQILAQAARDRASLITVLQERQQQRES